MTGVFDRRVIEEVVEIRSEEGRRPIISGYAAVFNSPSHDLGGFKEIVRPGAFSRSIASGANVRAYHNHDMNLLLGTTQSGTLRLSENQRGLKYEIDVPDTTYGEDLLKLVKRGDIRGSSFKFSNPKDQWNNQGTKRELIDVDLLDVSTVDNPAYEAAEIVSVRSLDAHKQHQGYDPELVSRRVAYIRLTMPN